MSLKTKHVYEFENFRFDVLKKVLDRDGVQVSVTPKVFETLQVLIEKAGQLIEKDELMQKVWLDRFVDESNLTFNIKMLRKALGDDAAHPRFIETVPRRGYRFIAETTEILSDNGNDPVALDGRILPETREEKPILPGFSFLKRNFSAAVLLVALLVCSIVASSWYLIVANTRRRSLAPIFSAPSKSESLSYSGSIFQPRISPDGKYIAYITKERDSENIWLRELKTRTNFPLLSSSADDYLGLMFSSNSDFVYFVRKPMGGSQDQSGIYRISIFGGIPTRVVTNNQGWFSLSPVDDRIAFVRYDANDRSLLTVTDADGKDERILATRERPYYFQATRWSTDGATIAAAVGQSDSGANDFGLIEINVDSHKERLLTQHKFLNIADLEWLPERSGLLFTARENTSYNNQIWRILFDNSDAEKVIDDGASYISLSLDKDAAQMAVSQTIPDFRLTIADLADPSDSFSTAAAASIASFTPSGKIIYAAALGQIDIWMMNPDGTEKRQLTNDPMDDSYALVSRDEKYVFFTSTRSGDHQIWRMKADGSDQMQITTTEGGFPLFISPEGSTLYYLSASNRDIWKVSVDGGEQSLFFNKRVLSPAFSPDGKYLAYFYNKTEVDNSLRLAVATADDLTEISSFQLQNEAARPVQIAWASDSLSFYYALADRPATTVWRQSLANKTPERIAKIGEGEIVLDFSLSPTGNKFAYVSGTWRREAKLMKGLQ